MRRVLLLALLCGWVLWEQQVILRVSSADERWRILRTYDARADCQADFNQLMHENSAWHAGYDDQSENSVVRRQGPVTDTKRALCVPATLDPRPREKE